MKLVRWLNEVRQRLELREEPITSFPVHLGRGDTIRMAGKQRTAERGERFDSMAAVERWVREGWRRD